MSGDSWKLKNIHLATTYCATLFNLAGAEVHLVELRILTIFRFNTYLLKYPRIPKLQNSLEIWRKNSMLRGKATLPLWFEPSHDYVGPAVTVSGYGASEPIYEHWSTGAEPVGLIN